MEPYGFAAIAAFDRLPFMKTGTTALGQSSYDRLGGNRDHDNFLAVDGEKVLLDVTGPGTVYRIWFGTEISGSAVISGVIGVEVDGRRYEHRLATLFAGEADGFPEPFVGVANGGCYCYVPLPFQTSMRITLSGGPATLVYYNIGLHRYPPRTEVGGWTPGVPADFPAARAVWNSDGRPPSRQRADEVVDQNAAPLAAGQRLPLLDITGPRTITSLRVRLNPAPDKAHRIGLDEDPLVVNNVWLRITWDDGRLPGVYAPLSSFFGIGRFARDSVARDSVPPDAPKRGIAIGIDDERWLYAYFPMPFRHRARIELESRLPKDVPSVEYAIGHRPFQDDFAQVGYFATAYARQFGRDGRGLTLLNVEGSGHLVGVTMSVEGPDTSTQDAPFCYRSNELCFLEGDERIYVDDSRTPALYGTGTEDFFNCGWYFRKVALHAPVHGCTTVREEHGHGVMSAYRLLLHDVVPFRKNLRVTIEHGPRNDVPVQAWTLAFYYYQPVTRAVLHDVLDLGHPASRQAHEYAHPAHAWEGSLTSTFEGDSNPPMTRHGFGHKGVSTFTMSVPPDNDGVVLRRLLDQHITNQRARVSIDGEEVGIWFRAGGHVSHVDGAPELAEYKWCEDDFTVPARYTRGKRRIAVQIQYLNERRAATDLDWNEFLYLLYALHDNDRAGASLLSPRAPAGTQIGVASRGTDKLDILVADYRGALVPAAWEPSQRTWQIWGAVRGIQVEPGAPVHMVSRSDDRLDAFATDVNGRIVSAAWEPGLPEWRSLTLHTRLLGGSGSLPAIAPRSAVTAVRRLPDHLDIFVIASDGHVYSTAWPGENGRWTDWFGLPHLTGFQGVPAHVVSRSAGKLDVFLAGTDGHVHTASWAPGAGWSVSNINERLEPASTIPPLVHGTVVTAVSRSEDHLDIFLVGADGLVYTAAWEPAFRFWRGWHSLQGEMRGKPGGPVHVVSYDTNRIDLFVTNEAGRVYAASWPEDGRWRHGELMPAPFAPSLSSGAPIAAVSRSTRKLDLFTIESGDAGGRVLTAAWEQKFTGPKPWRGWMPIGY